MSQPDEQPSDSLIGSVPENGADSKNESDLSEPDVWAEEAPPVQISEWIDPPKKLKIPKTVFNPCWFFFCNFVDLWDACILICSVPPTELPLVDTSVSYNPTADDHARVLALRDSWRKKTANVRDSVYTNISCRFYRSDSSCESLIFL